MLSELQQSPNNPKPLATVAVAARLQRQVPITTWSFFQLRIHFTSARGRASWIINPAVRWFCGNAKPTSVLNFRLLSRIVPIRCDEPRVVLVSFAMPRDSKIPGRLRTTYGTLIYRGETCDVMRITYPGISIVWKKRSSDSTDNGCISPFFLEMER